MKEKKVVQRFTHSEMQMVQGRLDGYSVDDIATLFGISSSTVKTHLSHARDKAGVKNWKELIEFTRNHAEEVSPLGGASISTKGCLGQFPQKDDRAYVVAFMIAAGRNLDEIVRFFHIFPSEVEELTKHFMESQGLTSPDQIPGRVSEMRGASSRPPSVNAP